MLRHDHAPGNCPQWGGLLTGFSVGNALPEQKSAVQ
jgi:hypothetical protein